MDIIMEPRKLQGTVVPPSSKSVAHRYVLASSLAMGTSVISGISPSKDIAATCECARAFGAEVTERESNLEILGATKIAPKPNFYCGESGSTFRFVIPVASVLCGGGKFYGQGRLLERPQEPYFHIFKDKNVQYTQENDYLQVDGTLKGGIYYLTGNVSSQFLTGLLYALPLCHTDSEIHLQTPLESVGYVDITIDVLQSFQIEIVVKQNIYYIKGNQTYRAHNAVVEKDYSQAAFFYVANGLGSEITVEGMREDSVQGDKAMQEIIRTIVQEENPVIDMSQVPDLMPITAVFAALQRDKTTQIVGGARLRMKESDRIATTAQGLNRLGGCVEETEDGVIIKGATTLAGGEINCHNDHRIAMAMAIASTCCEGAVTLKGAQCVDKSYPDFWAEISRLGGKLL